MPAAALEIADLGAIVVALAAILIVLGIRLWAQICVAAFRNVPFVGGWVADHLESAFVDGLTSLLGWLTSSVGALTALAWTPIQWLWQLVSDVIDATGAAFSALWWVAFTAIPQVASQAAGYAWQQGQAAIGYAEARFATAIGYVDARITWAVAYVDGRVVGAIIYTQQLVGSAVGAVRTELYAAVQWVNGEIVTVATGAEHALLDAWQRIWGGIEQLRVDVSARFGQVEQWTASEVQRVESEAQTWAHDAEQYAADAAHAAELAGLAAAGVVAADLETWLRTCGRNLCGGLNTLSTLLQALEPLVEGGLLIALAIEAYNDAPAVAHEIDQVAGGFIQGAAQDVLGQVGIAA